MIEDDINKYIKVDYIKKLDELFFNFLFVNFCEFVFCVGLDIFNSFKGKLEEIYKKDGK